tara:strand:- start:375 stop:524 length:150 start_codon:yes stop_codon:yes gene_type:complete
MIRYKHQGIKSPQVSDWGWRIPIEEKKLKPFRISHIRLALKQVITKQAS